MVKEQRKGTHHLRKGRVSKIGQYYLLTATTHNKIPVFGSPEAAQIVLSSLHWLEERGKIRLEAAVVMPDHLHFVAELCDGNLSMVMQSLKGYSARKINEILGRKGPLWQPQYHDHAIRKDEVLEEVTLYCLHNPVRAGLGQNFRDYPHWFCRWPI